MEFTERQLAEIKRIGLDEFLFCLNKNKEMPFSRDIIARLIQLANETNRTKKTRGQIHAEPLSLADGAIFVTDGRTRCALN